METALLFPHQLYRNIDWLAHASQVFLVEDALYFKQYRFHTHKQHLHRESMQQYAAALIKKGYTVHYLQADDPLASLQQLFLHFKKLQVTLVHYTDTTDYLLQRRIVRYSTHCGVALKKYPSPNFICNLDYLNSYFSTHKKYFLATFYQAQRKRLHILLEGAQPLGGKWSFDEDNRQKMPAGTVIPSLPVFSHRYPVNFTEADQALDAFLQDRLANFGVYQDALVKKEHFLFHSVLSSSLNTGLLDPADVLQKTISFATSNNIPLNSLEGFVRQVLGWREYIRAVYVREGVHQRTRNFLGFTRKMPAAFYSGTTGIAPVDTVIHKVQQTAYAHHIERLMILGNFMLLCEIDPNEVYQWFMELFIDAYDWVMVPNVYGMSQFADGGLMSTKPYISSSNYIVKMSDFKKGDWCDTWDALFWRFMHVHRPVLQKNPRLSMLLNTFDKMPVNKTKKLLATADQFLERLDAGITSAGLF